MQCASTARKKVTTGITPAQHRLLAPADWYMLCLTGSAGGLSLGRTAPRISSWSAFLYATIRPSLVIQELALTLVESCRYNF
jgi:hypothetical protein